MTGNHGKMSSRHLEIAKTGPFNVADSPGSVTTITPPPTPTRRRRPTPSIPYRKCEHLPPWKVILHNDEVNEVLYVVEVISRLTPLHLEAAYDRMLEAHTQGRSLLLVTHCERAELYREQFSVHHLTVSIEPDARD